MGGVRAITDASIARASRERAQSQCEKSERISTARGRPEPIDDDDYRRGRAPTLVKLIGRETPGRQTNFRCYTGQTKHEGLRGYLSFASTRSRLPSRVLPRALSSLARAAVLSSPHACATTLRKTVKHSPPRQTSCPGLRRSFDHDVDGTGRPSTLRSRGAYVLRRDGTGGAGGRTGGEEGERRRRGVGRGARRGATDARGEEEKRTAKKTVSAKPRPGDRRVAAAGG